MRIGDAPPDPGFVSKRELRERSELETLAWRFPEFLFWSGGEKGGKKGDTDTLWTVPLLEFGANDVYANQQIDSMRYKRKEDVWEGRER